MEKRTTEYKVFGAKRIEEGMDTFRTTSWDGSKDVLFYFPRKLSEEVKEEMRSFLLHDLDGHDDYDRFCEVMGIDKNKAMLRDR